MTRRSGRTLALVAALLLAAGSAAGRLLADETPSAGEAVEEATKEAVEAAAPKDAEPLDPLLGPFADEPAAAWTGLLLRLFAALVGAVLLVRAWLRWDRIRGGVLAAPPRRSPTVPFPLLGALGIWLLSFLVADLLVRVAASAAGVDLSSKSALLPLQLIVQTVVGLAVVALVERRRLRRASPPAPGLGAAVRSGAWAFFVASFVIFPVSLLWTAILQMLGHPPTWKNMQDVVLPVLDPRSPPWLPYAIGGYAVLMAPIVEETVYRALLFPGIRAALGDGRRAVWIGAVVTSVLFALVHLNLFAFLPLLALAMVLVLVFERTNSLGAVMIGHALFNFTAFVPMMMVRWT